MLCMFTANRVLYVASEHSYSCSAAAIVSD